MTTAPTLDPSQRQILVNLGNRFVVFGRSPGLPQTIHFDPETDSEVPPRIADAGEVAEARVAQTLRVSGMKRSAMVEEAGNGDLEMLDDDGNRLLIDLRVKERDPKQHDFDQAMQRLTEAASNGQILEVWYLNIERLKLVAMRLERSRLQIDELLPLDVWEKTPDDVINRAQVVQQVDDWVRRVGAL